MAKHNNDQIRTDAAPASNFFNAYSNFIEMGSAVADLHESKIPAGYLVKYVTFVDGSATYIIATPAQISGIRRNKAMKKLIAAISE